MRRFVALLLFATPAAAAERVPAPRLLPDESGFPAALKAALGDHFEYLGGEPGSTRGVVANENARRFWFARVRAKRSGVYTLSYTVHPTPPLRVLDTRRPEKVDYVFHIVIAEPGTRRIFHPHEPGRTSYPTATVGDTLVVPVHSDFGRTNYRFAPVEWEPLQVGGRGYDWETEDRTYRVQVEDWPAARVTVPAAFDTVTTWRAFDARDDAEGQLSSIGAYLSIAAPGSFNLAARLSDESSGVPGRMSLAARMASQAGGSLPSCPFRVVPRDKPVTVLLADFRHNTHFDGGGSDGMPGWVEPGTVEARVGEMVVIDCGFFRTPPGSVPDRSGVVEALPFRDVRSYEPR
ncbi:hypothetical protein J0H58_07980 [bacterium]|nr:hypothetical protein [bacterium]